MTETYTTGTLAFDAVIAAVCICMPELGNRVKKSHQVKADSPAFGVEPYAVVSMTPIGPVGHPAITHPDETITTAAPYTIRELIETEHRAVIAVEFTGNNAMELTEAFESRILGEHAHRILHDVGVGLMLVPATVEDATKLVGDRWRYGLARAFMIAWKRLDVLQTFAAESLVTPIVPTLAQET